MDVTTGNALAPLFISTVSNGSNSPLFRGGYDIKKIEVAKALSVDYLPESPVTTSEAAVVFHLQLPPAGEISGLPARTWRTAPARMKISPGPSKGMPILFDNEHQGHLQ